MDEQVYKSLKDILSSISNIELFCSSRPREYKAFVKIYASAALFNGKLLS